MNILILHTDQQRYDSLGCCGNPGAITPHLDALAADGTLYTRHFSANPVCMPSRCSLITGTYPSRHGVVANGIPLADRKSVALGKLAQNFARSSDQSLKGDLVSHLPTIGEHLKNHGYSTAAFGKLHLTPTQCDPCYGNKENREMWLDGGLKGDVGPYYGFDSYLPAIGHGEHTIGAYAEWLEAVCPWFRNQAPGGSKAAARPSTAAPGDAHPSNNPEAFHHSTWLGNLTCDFIAKQTEEKPFFAFVGFPDPHHPWTPPEETLREYRKKAEEAGVDLSTLHCHSSLGKEIKLSNPYLSPEHRPKALEAQTLAEQQDAVNYLQELTNIQNYLIDKQVGRVVAALKQQGLYDDTVIIFTSDHGDFLGDYGQARKIMYTARSLCHVSMIMKAPGIAGGRVDETAGSNVDIVPTICDLLDLDPPATVQGQSLLQVERSSLPMSQALGLTEGPDHLTIWDDHYRLTYFPAGGQVELFHHPSDPEELVDVAGFPDHRQAQERLLGRLLRQTAEVLSPIHGRIANW